MKTIIAATILALAPAPVLADASEASTIGVLVGAKAGGIVPLDGLSPFVHGGVEVGYVLPALARRLAIVVTADYTQPTATGVENDPRVMGGTYSWKLTEQQLGLMLTATYRVTSMTPVIPYAGIGPRVLLARSKVGDDGGPMISTTREQSTRVGIGVPVGAELPLGPGALTGELLLQYGTYDHVATGDAHTGAISLAFGFRAVF